MIRPDIDRILQNAATAQRLSSADADNLLHKITVAHLDRTQAEKIVRDALELPASESTCTALRSFIEADTREKPSGLLARWFGRSPAPATHRPSVFESALRAQQMLKPALDARAALTAALAPIDPALEEAVKQELGYAVGLTGALGLFPPLRAAVEQWMAATPTEREGALTFMRETLLPLTEDHSQIALLGKEIAAGKSVDMRTAADLARAAALGSISPAELREIAKQMSGSAAGVAFARAFAETFDGLPSLRKAWAAASSAAAATRDVLEAFKIAVEVAAPELAALGHTVLLLWGDYPKAHALWAAIKALNSEDTVKEAQGLARRLLST